MSTDFNSYFKTWPVSFLKKSLQGFEQLIYPLKCLKCGAYIDPKLVKPHTMAACFCDICMKDGFFPIETPYCIKCGLKFHQNSSGNHVCEACIKTPLKVEKVRAVVEYKGIIKDAIPLFKYSSKLAAAKVFELLLFQAFINHYKKMNVEWSIPIPWYKTKLRERGCNQAFLMVRNFIKLYEQHFGQNPSWEIDTGSLIRIKKTEPQTGFDIEERKNNLKKAFKVVDKNRVKEKNIVLIDDVLTTGATCNEAALELLKNGAGRVDALVLART